MTSCHSVKLFLVVWLLLGGVVPNAHADPLRITEGVLGYPLLNSARLRVEFPNGSAAITWENEQGDWIPDFYVGCCYSPGQQFNMSTDDVFGPSAFGFSGELQFGGELYSVTSFSFSVVAESNLTVPIIEEGQARFVPGGPFTFNGHVSGRDADARTITVGLIGFGGASALLTGITPAESDLAGAVYMFDSSPAVVPEPGTWLLVATGVGAMIRQRRKRRDEGR